MDVSAEPLLMRPTSSGTVLDFDTRHLHLSLFGEGQTSDSSSTPTAERSVKQNGATS